MFLSVSFADRLLDIKENEKFRGEGSAEDQAFGLRRVLVDIKEKYLIKYGKLLWFGFG